MSLFSLSKKLLICLAMGGASLAQAAPGDLDPTFGIGGKVKTPMGIVAGARALLIQSDGKLVAGGSTAYPPTLARYLPNGNLDTSFGSKGIVFPAGDGSINKIVQQTDGKLVAVGSVLCGVRLCFAVWRYNLDGNLDGSFGIGGEITRDYVPTGGGSSGADAVVIQPDGGIVVAGYADGAPGREFVVARFLLDGTNDFSFGFMGVERISFGGPAPFDEANAIVLKPDGKLIVGGSSRIANGFGLVQLDLFGHPDLAFGIAGKVMTTFDGAEVEDLVLQPDGAIVAAGRSSFLSSGFALARYTPIGLLDPSFGTVGKVITNGFGPANAHSLILQPDGKLVAAGDINDQFGLIRYLPNGTPDTTFGNNGAVQTDFGTKSSIYGLAQQSDGKLVVAGTESGEWEIPLARYANITTASTTIVGSSLNPASIGQSITFNATISGAEPTGTMDFSDGAAVLCSGVALVGTGNVKTASCASSLATTGAHNIVGYYGGDANNNPSTGNLVQQIDPVATATTLSSSLNPSSASQNVVLTATVSGVDPTGAVRFQDGATAIPGCSTVALAGTGNSRTASCMTASLTVGSHTLSAVYGGDPNNTASNATLTQLVNVPVTNPTITVLSSSLNPSVLGQSVTFIAAVNGIDATGTVDFAEGAVVLCSGVPLAGTGSTKLAACTASSLTVGSHTISAAYHGDAGNGPSGATLIQQVNGPTPTTTTTTLSSSLNPSMLGQGVMLTAGVNGNNPSGTVSFHDGAAPIMSCDAVPLTGMGNSKTAVCLTTTLAVGVHAIRATYSGDGANLTSLASVTQTVNDANATVLAAPALSEPELFLLAAVLAGMGLTIPRSGRHWSTKE